METVSIRQAKTHLSRLVERAARGEPFVIAKAGKPLVKVVPLSTANAGRTRRLGFMIGQMTIPADFDRMEEDAVIDLFERASRRFCPNRPCCPRPEVQPDPGPSPPTPLH